MSQLSAQSIRRLCQTTEDVYRVYDYKTDGKFKGFLGKALLWGEHVTIPQIPMISPFIPDKQVFNGKSYGLSSASYDCRIRETIELGPIGSSTCCSLAHTIERFCIPDNVCAYVCDKSSYARVFVSALNTLFDPGFSGKTEDNENPDDPYASAVLELVNLGNHSILIEEGSPIVQFAFHWLDEPTDRPYRGKYSGQKGAQPAIYEDNTVLPSAAKLGIKFEDTPYGKTMMDHIDKGGNL